MQEGSRASRGNLPRVTGHYLTPDTTRLGLEGQTARESIALLRQSEQICEGLCGDNLDKLLVESLRRVTSP